MQVSFYQMRESIDPSLPTDRIDQIVEEHTKSNQEAREKMKEIQERLLRNSQEKT